MLRCAGRVWPLLFAFALFASCAAEERDRNREAAIAVKTMVVRRGPFAPAVTLLGTIRPAHTVALVAVRGGTIRYPARFRGGLRTGESVRAGELVAEVHNGELASQQAQAKLQVESNQSDFERADRSFKAGIVSAAEFSSYEIRVRIARENLAAVSREMDRLRIVATESGKLVVARTLATGSEIEAGATIAEVATSGAPEVESAASMADRDLLRPGLHVRLSDPRAGGWQGEGVLTEVASVIDAAGTARVRARIANPSGAPPPGAGVQMTVELDRRPDVLTVPEEAIVAGSEGPAVYVIGAGAYGEGAQANRVAVQTGTRAGGRIEIRSGLRDGDRVVVSGADALSDGAVVVESADGKTSDGTPAILRRFAPHDDVILSEAKDLRLPGRWQVPHLPNGNCRNPLILRSFVASLLRMTSRFAPQHDGTVQGYGTFAA